MNETATQSRGPILGFFTLVANAYLVLFALNAVLSVIDDWVFAGAGSLSTLRAVVASINVLASLVMIFVVVFVPQLPKLVFVPLILTSIWMAMGAPPIAAIGAKAAMPFLSLCQLALAVAAFMVVQIRAGGWFFTSNQLPRKDHLFLRIAFASIVVVALVPVAVVAFGAWALATTAEEQTGGYIKFTWTEVLARETVMRKDTKVVRLVATAHIAEGDFYRTVYASVSAKAVVLAEGISDAKESVGNMKALRPRSPLLGPVPMTSAPSPACWSLRHSSWRSQLMHVSVQKFTRTTWPRSSAGSSGPELSHSVAPPSEGMCRRSDTVV